jgi:hypothetical protein
MVFSRYHVLAIEEQIRISDVIFLNPQTFGHILGNRLIYGINWREKKTGTVVGANLCV